MSFPRLTNLDIKKENITGDSVRCYNLITEQPPKFNNVSEEPTTSKLALYVDSDGNVTKGSVGSNTSVSLVGDGVFNFLNQGTGDLEFRGIKEGTNVNFDVATDGITINSVTPSSNLGSGEIILSNPGEDNLQFKTLVAGSNVILTPSANSITIESVDTVGVSQLSNTSSSYPGQFVVASPATGAVQLKRLGSAASQITVANNSDNVELDFVGLQGIMDNATSSGTGTLVTGSPVGSGVCQIKKLVAGSGVTLTNGTNDVTIAASSSVPDLGFSVILRTNVTAANASTGGYVVPSGLLVTSGAYYNTNNLYNSAGFTVPVTGKWLCTTSVYAQNDDTPGTGTVINDMGSMLQFSTVGDFIPNATFHYGAQPSTFVPTASWTSVLYLTNTTTCYPLMQWSCSTSGTDPAIASVLFSMKYLGS